MSVAVLPGPPPVPTDARAPVWQLAIASFLPVGRRHAAMRWIARLPLALVLLAQVALTLRLTNTAHGDEALYIDAGHDHLDGWLRGAEVPDYGGYFSGLPTAYPVLAGVLDGLGGLEAVRTLSLLAVLGATLAVHAIGRSLGGARAGLLAAGLFVLSGPVLFAGRLGTFDGPVIFLLAAATALAVTRSGLRSAAVIGLALAAAAVMKYTGAVFAMPVLALVLVTGSDLRRSIARTAVAATVGLGVAGAVYLANAHGIRSGIEFTTADREAHNYRSIGFLLRELVLSSGPLVVVAIIGAVVLVTRERSWRALATAGALLGAAALLPAGQLLLHEYTSFNKHLAYSAVFLAPLAGAVAIALRGRAVRWVPMAATVWVMFVLALSRSLFLFTEWPDATQVVAVVREDPLPGTYLGVGGSSMAYYGKDLDGVVFEEPWALYGAGEEAIREAIDDSRYRGVIYRSGATGSDALDAHTALTAELVAANPDYTLVASWPVHRYDLNHWFVWVRLDDAG